MATNSFFFGETPSPEANTVDQLIDSLNEKLQEATGAKDSAEDSAASATASANNAASSQSAAFEASSQAVTASITAINEANSASSSATLAASSATSAATSATASANSALAALASQTASAASESATALLYDQFDDRYLGSKATDPTLDNDGNALVDGALFFDTALNVMKVYDLGTTTWVRTTPTTSDQANINSVTTNATNINTVAGSIANVNTTAGSIANVNTTATNIANVNTVAGISGNVTTVATNNTNVTTVANNIGSVNTVSGISANVSTVAGISGAVTTVSANITDIQNAEENADAAALSAFQAATSASSASTSASNASGSAVQAANSATASATSATASATSATASANSASSASSSASSATSSASSAASSASAAAASYDQFDDRYLGAKAFAPAVDNDGQPLVTGALYYNTTTGNMNVWKGTVWGATYLPTDGYAPLADPAFTGSVTENGLGVVSQADIGTAPNEIPLNQYLGSLAYQSSESAIIESGRIDLKGGGSNLLSYSQEFNQTYWQKGGTTVTVNNTTAPNGTNTGTVFTCNTTSAIGNIVATLTSLNNTTLSIYAKAGTTNFIGLTNQAGSNSWATFNVSTGVIASSSNCTPIITDAGNGWYRCAIQNCLFSGNQFLVVGKDADPNAQPYNTGNWTGGGTLYIWGFQQEKSAIIGNYIATTTTATPLENASGATALSVIPTTGFDTTYPLAFELASNTSLVVKVKGSDGTVRSATLTLA